MDKVGDESELRPGLIKRVFSRKNVAGIVLGIVPAAALGGGMASMCIGFLGVRWIYSKTEQHVPFTSRRHVILLPTTAEVMLGEKWYDDFLSDAATKRTLLKADHPDTLLVVGIAQRLVAALQGGHGGGYQKHLSQFKWQVSVVNQNIANAFVFSGGKIVVYVGLLDLLGRDTDLIAMVMGHEIAHALARHSSEKMGLGLAVSLAASLALSLVSGGPSEQQRQVAEQRQRELEMERMRRGYHRTYSKLLHEAQEQHQQQLQPMHARAQAGSAPGQVPAYLSEQFIKSLSSVVLELPFSRRAETEADLIGLKLMALAGFNAAKGPQAFVRLAEASGGGGHKQRSAGDAFLAGLGCTHPDSRGRAECLQRELDWMRKQGVAGVEAVGTKVDYWSTGVTPFTLTK